MPLPSSRPQVKKYLDQGLSAREISKIMDISLTRIYQIKKILDAEKDPMNAESNGASDA